MARQFKAVAFDLDGTILDTSAGILASIKHTIQKFGLKPLEEDQLRRFIGPPIQNSFAKYYGLEGSALKEAAAVFRDRYKTEDLLKAVPYEGIYDVFEALCQNGIKLVIATYKREDYAVALLQHFEFHKYTNIMCGSDFEGSLQKKDILENALRSAGISDYGEAVMVGDKDNDAVGAESIGAAFIGVTYGFGFRTKRDVYQFRAVGAADRPRELIEILVGG